VGAHRKEGTDPVSEFFYTGFQQGKDSFHQQRGLNLKKELTKFCILNLVFFYGAETWTPGK
jgi:hypothetical protein